MTTPDWLAKREGELREGTGRRSWLVFLDGEPQYRLTPVPAAGKLSCEVVQTVNGQRLEAAATYPSVEDAVRGGLEDLRKALGW